MLQETHAYDDIIMLPHHTSKVRPRMPMHDRAAQFSSFDALTGYSAMIEETERLTHNRIELDETEKEILDEKLRIIEDHIVLHPVITVVYFVPDERKDGGAYLSHTGSIKRIDAFERCLIFYDRMRIPVDDLYEIESEFFRTVLDED